jgi:AraC-like DNA-binding protein
MTGKEQHSWISLKPASNDVEWASTYFRDLAFSPHRHDSYAIGYTTTGVQSFDYRGESRHSCAGDMFVLHPDEIHDGRQGTDQGYGYRIVYLAPELVREALGGGTLPFVAEAVTRDRRLGRLLASAFPDTEEAEDDVQQSGAITTVADILNTLARGHGRRRVHLNAAVMKRVREQLMENLPASVAMTTLEDEHGIDRYSLTRQFRLAFGVTPHRFVTMRRLDIAKRRIQAGQSLAQAALAAGFADQSHMTRQFRRAFGLSPGTWRSLLGA